jgi:hypothetical protein
MRRKDYYSKIKNLHKQVIEDIKSLMLEKGKAVIDLAGSEAPYAFIIGVPDFNADVDYMEAEVLKVILEDGKVKFDINWDMDAEEYLEKYPNENGDIGDLYQVVDADDFTKLIPCAAIDSVYDAVYEYLKCGYVGDDDEDIKE